LTKLEKLVPKPKWEAVFTKYIAQADPMPIAVAASDARPEYSLTPSAEGFDNVMEDFSAFQ